MSSSIHRAQQPPAFHLIFQQTFIDTKTRKLRRINHMNKLWHEMHLMPRAASMEERLAWHLEHAKNCGCRPLPGGIRALIEDMRLKQEALASRRFGSS